MAIVLWILRHVVACHVFIFTDTAFAFVGCCVWDDQLLTVVKQDYEP